MKQQLFLDGAPLSLGSRLAEGGEGTIFRLNLPGDLTHPKLVKLYKEEGKSRERRILKARVLRRQASEEVRHAVVLPLDEVTDSSGAVVGHTMEHLAGWVPLFMLYQTKSRVQKLAESDWGLLVRVARNLATSIQFVHERGWVIGDLNESNSLVSPKAVVKLIDVDSFQVAECGKVLPCPVAKSELLAPEYSGLSLENLERSQEGDLFSLAVLIFQILLLGRHPFAGRPLQSELTLEETIVRQIYPYRPEGRSEIAPPPHVSINWVSQEIQALFLRSFEGKPEDRPLPSEWILALKNQEKNLTVCGVNPLHKYNSELQNCPWCECEKVWGVPLFEAQSTPNQILPFEVGDFVERVTALPIPSTVEKPEPILWSEVKRGKHFRDLDVVFLGLAVVLYGALAMISVEVLMVAIPMILGVFGLGAVVRAVVRNSKGNKWRKILGQYATLLEEWDCQADPDLFVQARRKLIEVADWQRVECEMRAELETKAKMKIYEPQLLSYLAKYSIHVANCDSLTPRHKESLAAAGVTTAANISEASLQKLIKGSGDGERFREELLQWRDELEEFFWNSSFFVLPQPTQSKIEQVIARARHEAQDALRHGEARLLKLSDQLMAQQRLLGQQLHALRREAVEALSKLPAQGESFGLVNLDLYRPKGPTLKSQPAQAIEQARTEI